MTVLEGFESASCEAGVVKVVFCDLIDTQDKFVSIVKGFSIEQFPINIINPGLLQSSGTWESGRRRSFIDVDGFICTRVKENTKTYRDREMQDSTIEPMTKINLKYIRNLMRLDFYDTSRSMTDNVRAAYQISNLHLFGTHYTVRLPIVDKVC